MNAPNTTIENAVVVNPTVGENELSQEIQHTPVGAFLKYPLGSVRDACLRRINRLDAIQDNQVALIKKIIIELRAQHDERAERFLEFLVMKSYEGMIPVAIEFAIQLAMKNPVEINYIAKLVAAKFHATNSSGAYWYVPSIESFITLLLEQVKSWESYEYTDADWFQVQRAVNIILMFGDTSFLPALKNMLDEMKSGKIKLRERAEPCFKIADHLHFLKTRIGALSEIARAETPDWNTLGLIAKKGAKLVGNINVFFLCSPTVNEGEKAIARIHLKSDNPEEQQKLNEWVRRKNLTLGYFTEGFNGIDGAYLDESGASTKFYGDACGAYLGSQFTPKLGKNRLTIRVFNGNKELLNATAYIRCVKEATADAPTAA